MKTIYLDCSMGAAGDMLMGALLELIPAPDSFMTRLNYLGIPKVHVTRETSVRCGLTGTHISVTVDGAQEDETLHLHDNHDGHDHSHEGHGHSHEGHGHSHEGHGHSHEGHSHSHEGGEVPHQHGSFQGVREIIQGLELSQAVRDNALAVYGRIAEAESKAHGVPVDQVHFHEVGQMDAIADIVGVCMLMEELAPDRVTASPVHVGSGQVRCAHGILPVPAPATADILRGVPIYGGEIKSELCTPTGAALLRQFVTSFGNMPVMAVTAVGYGMGKKEFETANCLRAMLGEQASPYGANDRVVTLSCNLDDMTGEAIGFACASLMELGALDVYTIPITMKKSRPAVMLNCLVTPENADNLAAEMLRCTTTFGVRRSESPRYILDRVISTVATKYGPIRVKSGVGYGVDKVKPEYDDVAQAAKQHGLSISEVLQALEL